MGVSETGFQPYERNVLKAVIASLKESKKKRRKKKKTKRKRK